MSYLRLTAVGLLALVGCSQSGTQPAEAPVPKYDPDAIAQAALSEFDKSKDGALDATEARACPALAGAFAAIDANNDRRLSADELRKRVEAYAASATGSIEVECLVRVDDQPLEGATVTFEPEACMGQTVKLAVGTTDADGRCAEYKIDGNPHRGIAPGLYKIRITKDGAAVPAKYNTQTILGREVFPTPREAGVTLELELSSR